MVMVMGLLFHVKNKTKQHYCGELTVNTVTHHFSFFLNCITVEYQVFIVIFFVVQFSSE